MAKFKRGESGNPAGRPKGIPDRRSQLIRQYEDDIPALLEVLKQKALSGDMAALKLILDRLLPVKRSSFEVIEIPSLGEAETLIEKAEAVMASVSSGEIPPDVGSQLISAIGTTARVEEISELKDRIESLEAAMRRRAGK